MITNEEANILINKSLEDERMKGKVKWFDAGKGFGFITKETGDDIFVHFQDIQMDGYKTLNEGEEVEFDIESTGKGDCARNVKKL